MGKPKRELVEPEKSELCNVIYLKCFNTPDGAVYNLKGLETHSAVKELQLEREDLSPSYSVVVKRGEGRFGANGHAYAKEKMILVLENGWLLLFLSDPLGEKFETVNFKTMPPLDINTGFLFPVIYVPPEVARYVYNPFDFEQNLIILSRTRVEEVMKNTHERDAIGGKLELILGEMDIEI